MTPAPLVSVLLPVRNGMPWLPEAIDSILSQTWSDFELLVIEDGSTDATAVYAGGLTDPRVRIIRTGGVGIAGALNIGLREARGEYVARHDADDVSRPTRFARQVQVLFAHPDVAVVSTNADYIDDAGRPVDNAWTRTVREQQDVATTPDAIAALMPTTCCVVHGSVMARAQVLRDAGGYRAEFEPADDYDLWLRLLPGHQFHKLADRLYVYRLHDAQLGATIRETQIRNAIRAKLLYVRRLYPGLPSPAGLRIVGGTRGDAYYAAIAPEIGFEPCPQSGDWDVAALTDFGTLGDSERALRRSSPHALTTVGNLLVRADRAVS
jgi:glycosyltransferase involved in cell wall biosynthesis